MSTTRPTAFCPPWCVSDFDIHDCSTESNTARPVMEHGGPRFGPFYAGASTYLDTLDDQRHVMPRVELFDTEGHYLSAMQLRALAANALAAAVWLEAQQ